MKQLKRLCMVFVLGIALYGALGFWLLPTLALQAINQQLAQQVQVPARLEQLRFNPFTLRAQADGFRIGPSEAPQFQLKQLSLQVAWDSLWTRRLHIQYLEFTQPDARIQRQANGEINISQWFSKPRAHETPDDSAPLPPILIDRIQLNQGQSQLQDSVPNPALNLSFDQWQVLIQNLSTQPQQSAQIQIELRQHDAKINWQGQIRLNPLHLEGQLRLEGFDLAPWRGYVPAHVLEQGRLSLTSQVNWDAHAWELNQLHIQAQNLRLSAGEKYPLLKLNSFRLAQASVQSATRQIRIGQIDLQKLESWITRETDGRLNWQTLLPQTAQTSAADTATNTANHAKWQLQIDKAQLESAQLHLTDRQPKTPVQLEVNDLNIAAQKIDTTHAAPIPIQVEARLGLHGRLNAQGQVNLSTAQSTVQVKTQDIDLRLAQAYLDPWIAVELRSGMLNTDLGLSWEPNKTSKLRVQGAVEVTQFHALDRKKNQDLLTWQRLRVAGIDYQHQESLNMTRVDLIHPFSRFVINPDLSTNLSELTQTGSGSNNGKQAPPSSRASTNLHIQLGSMQVVDGSAYFADRSLEPDFATSIQSLSGEIGRLDNQSNQAARIVLKGKVDRYSPVWINGNLTPFNPLQNLDVTARFQQLEMTNLTPYSGKFAGYRIRKGRLNLDLHYRIQKRQLTAENKIIIHQLQLGDAVDSAQAPDIPVRLAVALLKDSSGIINLDIPLQGSLDDPNFRVLPLLGQSLRNLISKAVQAPFRLLGSLVELGQGSNQLGEIPFSPGSTDLDEEARTQLNKLAIALKERPNLMLEVEGAANPKTDGPPMAQNYLEQEFRQTWYKTLQKRGEKVPATPDLLQVSETDKTSMLDELYQARLKTDPPAAWNQLEAEQRQLQLRQAILASWGKSKTLLRKLSQERASAIKQYLVSQGKLDNTRIYLLDSNLDASNLQGKVITSLYLAGP